MSSDTAYLAEIASSEHLESLSTSSTSSEFRSLIMTPSTLTSHEAASPQVTFTPEMISALFERSDMISRREGAIAEREEFLKYQVAAIVRRENEVDRRERELGFKKLPAMEKLRVALEQLEETEMMEAIKMLHEFQIKIFSKALLPMSKQTSSSTNTDEIDAEAVVIVSEHSNNASDSVKMPKSNSITEGVQSTVELERGEMKPCPKENLSPESAKVTTGSHEEDPKNSKNRDSIVSREEKSPDTTDIDSIHDSPVTVDNQSGAGEKNVKGAADQLKADHVFHKPVNDPQLPSQNTSARSPHEALQKGLERKYNPLNTIEWPPVDEGQTSQNKTTAPSYPSFTFASVPVQRPKATNSAYSSPFHQGYWQSDCFRTPTPFDSRTANIPPPPKRTWPVKDTLKGPGILPHPFASVNELPLSTESEPGLVRNPKEETEPEPVFKDNT